MTPHHYKRPPFATLLTTALLMGCGPSSTVEESTEVTAAPEVLSHCSNLDELKTIIEGAPSVGAHFELQSPKQCEMPEKRAQTGAYYRYDPGPAWQVQNANWDELGVMTGGGVAIGDVNGDGLYDIVLPHMGQNQVYIGIMEAANGRLIYDDQTELRLPKDPLSASTGVTLVDVDGDNDLDIFFTNLNLERPNQLLINNGAGIFTDQTQVSGIATARGLASMSSSWADMDLDGDLDLFVANHQRGQNPTDCVDPTVTCIGDPNQLYRNRGDGSFENITAELPHDKMRDGYSFIGGWLDLNNDLYPELYVVSDYGPIATPNVLSWNNKGTLSFDEDNTSSLNIPMFGMGLGQGDTNCDLVPDILCASWDRLYLMESTKSGFWIDTTFKRNIVIDTETNRHVAWGTEFADLDNDGDQDAMAAYGFIPNADDNLDEFGYHNPYFQPDAIFIQQEDGLFEQQAEQFALADPEAGRGYVLVDLNDDGYLDIVKRLIGLQARIYMSQCGSNGWLKVKLNGPSPNTRAVGAKVFVQQGERSWVRWMSAGSTVFLSGGSPELHFGLGDLETVDAVTVLWPSGEVSTLDGPIDVNRSITITHPAGSSPVLTQNQHSTHHEEAFGK